MNELTLALNSDYTPMAFLKWERAMVLLCENKVSVLEAYDTKFIHTSQAVFPMPAVVVFKKYARKKKRVIKFSREGIWLRDRGVCQYCGKPVDRDRYTYDHVNPRHKGGKTDWDNIVCACYSCNQKKGGHTLKECGMNLLRAPFKPDSLPNDLMQTIAWKKSMPKSWANWLVRSVSMEG